MKTITIPAAMFADLLEFKTLGLIECQIEEGMHPPGSELNKLLILDEAKYVADQLVQNYGGDLHEIQLLMQQHLVTGPAIQ